MLEKYRYINTGNIRKCLSFDISNIFFLDKLKVAYVLFIIGLVITFFASIHVMYFWLIEPYVSLITMPFFVGSVVLSLDTSRNIFTRTDYLLPALLAILVQYYQSFVNQQNIVPYILATASFAFYYALFRLDKSYISKISTIICKIFGGFLILSMLGFFMYLLGVNLPAIPIDRGLYSYNCYFLFLVDDRELFSIIPRFNSVFLEPGHMGTTIVLLLATQIGHWKKWYNISLFVGLFLSFSLAAYGILVILLFLRLWILRKKIMQKIIILLLTISAVVGGSFLYNGGDNMLNQLIVMRLEMNDDGDGIEGNNRVSEDFEKEFDRFIITEDAIFGNNWDQEAWGFNSGYRVYIYDFGLMGFALFMLFYYVSFRKYKDYRCLISAFIISLANFWTRGYPLIVAFYVPYFLFAHLDVNIKQIEKKPEERT